MKAYAGADEKIEYDAAGHSTGRALTDIHDTVYGYRATYTDRTGMSYLAYGTWAFAPALSWYVPQLDNRYIVIGGYWQ